MGSIMTRGTVRLKGRDLLKRYNVTMYRVAKDGDISYGTVHRIVNDDSGGFNAETLYSFLVGLGLSDAEIAQLTMSEIFEFLPHEQVTT